MAVIPEQMLNSVVALGVESVDRPGEKFWIGSGFIVSRKEASVPGMATFYLVTNKHVVSNVNKLYVRFNSLGDSLVKDYPIQLYDANKLPQYSSHPNPETDVIAVQIIPQTLENDKVIWSAFDLNMHTLTLKEMFDTGVVEGALVYSLGFPMNLVDVIKAPVCRLGCVSRFRDAYIKSKKNPTFLIDAQTFPGNSGGAVISRPELTTIDGTPTNTKANLIGIVSAYIPYQETLVSSQTNRKRMIQEENSGLTIVHPVDRIKEVVEIEWNRLKALDQAKSHAR